MKKYFINYIKHDEDQALTLLSRNCERNTVISTLSVCPLVNVTVSIILLLFLMLLLFFFCFLVLFCIFVQCVFPLPRWDKFSSIKVRLYFPVNFGFESFCVVWDPIRPIRSFIFNCFYLFIYNTKFTSYMGQSFERLFFSSALLFF